jgi:hypothetical protein
VSSPDIVECHHTKLMPRVLSGGATLATAVCNGCVCPRAAGVPKQRALNKVGHGLHLHDPVFRRWAQASR